MTSPKFHDLAKGVVIEGPILAEPVEVIMIEPVGDATKLIGKGLHTGRLIDPILNAAQLAQLTLARCGGNR